MKNKSLIVGAIVLSLVVVLSLGTYAYWTLTRSQKEANTLIGGCLNIDISESSEAISLDKTWPISDFEGMQLEGYTFTVTEIGNRSFSHNSLEHVIIPDSVTELYGGFDGNYIKEYIIGTGVTELFGETFAYNEIEHVIIPDNITIIGGDFMGNPIKSIKIGSGLEYLGDMAFSNEMGRTFANNKEDYYNQNFLTEVFIPSNVKYIGINTFGTATSDVIIRTERTKEDFLANVEADITFKTWHGKAQVISSDGLNIYE